MKLKKAILAVMEAGTVWLSLNQIVELYWRGKSVISRHIKNIFEDGELDLKAVVAEYATTVADGKTYKVRYYNLDMILTVGYRVIFATHNANFPVLRNNRDVYDFMRLDRRRSWCIQK